MTEVTFTKHYSSIQRLTALPVNGKPHTFSPADKAVYFYLLAYQESTGKVFPSIPTLSDELGMSQSTIKRSLKFLRDTSLIKSERRYDDSNLYSVTPIADVLRLVSAEVKQDKRIVEFSVKAVETILRILGMFGINIKQCAKQSEEWGFNTSEASQEALQQDISPSPVKMHSKETKPPKSAPADDCEIYSNKEEFIDTFVFKDNSNLKHDPNGW